MNYGLPTTVEINGNIHKIRAKGDYRAVLDVISALNDPDLDEKERAYCALYIFYEDYEKITDLNEAARQMMIFINVGDEETEGRPSPKLMDWEQDFKMIVAPINRVIGKEIRSLDYLHWWSFISAYYEIGECCFSTVVSIRDKRQRGKKLEKWEQDYARKHPELVNIKTKVSSEEQALIDELLS